MGRKVRILQGLVIHIRCLNFHAFFQSPDNAMAAVMAKINSAVNWVQVLEEMTDICHNRPVFYEQPYQMPGTEEATYHHKDREIIRENRITSFILP